MRRLLGWFAVVPVLAFAQQQSDPVVVTATRVEQPSLEVPASIDRIYGEDLREGRAQVNLSESLGRVPGLVILDRQNYAQDLQISSRGFGARATFGVRGISLIADGIPASMPDGQGQSSGFDLGSASRIEVLRGPFSALYGNAAGGVINVTTEDPTPVPTLDAGLYVGTYGTQREAVKFGWQNGNVGYLVDGSNFETDGYRDHSAAQRDLLNTKLKIGLGQDTGLTLVGMSLRQADTQDPLGLNRTQVAQNPEQAGTNATQFNTRKSIFHDQVGATLDHALTSSTKLQASAWTGSRDVTQYLAIPLAAQAPVTSSGGVVDLDRTFGGAALRVFSDASLGGRLLRIAAGLEYGRMNEHRQGYINNFGVAGALKRDEDNVAQNTDLFAQGEWRFAERWSATAGVRTSRVSFDSTDHFIVAGNGDDSGSQEYHATTPVVGLLYRLDKLTSLYANYGQGFETPTFVELAYRNSGTGLNFDLQPAHSDHVEVGVKAVRPGLARVNAAVYHVETRDEIVTDQNVGGRTTYRNAGHTTRTGLELGAESLVEGPFEARGAYTWIDARYANDFGTIGAGNALPAVPGSQLYVEGAWHVTPTGPRLSLEGLYRAKVPVNDANSEFAPSYAVFNAVASIEQKGTSLRLTEFLRVNNVLDRQYIGSVIVNDGNGRYYEPAPGRNVMVGLQATLQF
ncbi:MAG: TonB-dependent receptor family protein [Burkholderiales bacterium]